MAPSPPTRWAPPKGNPGSTTANELFSLTSLDSVYLLHLMDFLPEPVAFVEFDKFQEGDIITFKEGIPREVSCTAFQSLPAADVSFKIGDKLQPDVNLKSNVCIAFLRHVLLQIIVYIL